MRQSSSSRRRGPGRRGPVCRAGTWAGILFLCAVLPMPSAPAAQAPRPATSPATPAEAGAADAQKPKKKKKKNPVRPDLADEYFQRGPVPALKVELTPEDADSLRREPRKYVKAKIHELAPDGKLVRVYEEVAVHLKGAAGSFRQFDDRPALTVNFGKHRPGQRFHGMDKIHLNNSVQDGSYLCEYIGSAVFRDAGIPAARSGHARVAINERDLGFYVLKEGFDDSFLKRFFEDDDGPLYDGGFVSDIDRGEVPAMTNKKKANQERIKLLVSAARERDAALRRQRLAQILDVDKFLTLIALEAMLAHWDGYAFNRNNYRFYDDPASGRFVFLPHGMDQLFQQPGHALVGGGALLARAVTEDPEDRERLMDRIEELRRTVFTPEKLAGHVQRASARMQPILQRMGPRQAEEHRNQVRAMLGRINERIKFIDQQLASRPRPLKFDAQGVALVPQASWALNVIEGNATLDVLNEFGKPKLRVRCAAGGGTASIRSTVLLPKGKYVFSGRVRTAGVVAAADGANAGAGLRISGAQRTAKLVGDNPWKDVSFEFEVTDAMREVILVCELAARRGEAWFDPATLKVKKQ